MSCPSSNNTPINLSVSFGQLPEGYCPANLQDLGNAIAARLIITPAQGNTSFVSGSTQPTSNQGPWFKNCEELFIFSDTLSKYIPAYQLFNNFQVFDASGTFTVPSDVYRVKVEAWGAGGGGGDKVSAQGGGGGGAGAYGLKFLQVVPTQAVPVTVGTAGAGGNPAVAGGASTFLTLSAGGGAAGDIGSGGGGEGGIGGVVTGADIGINGQCGETSDGALGQANGGIGGNSPNGGGGGVSSITAAKLIGVVPGGGGAGGANALVNSGGMGAHGRIIVWW